MKFKEKITVKELALIAEGKVLGDENLLVSGLNNIADSVAGDMTFYSDEKFEKYFLSVDATCILVSDKIQKQPKQNQAFIVVDKPYNAFIKVVNFVYSKSRKKTPSVHPTAVIDETAKIGENVYIGPFCSIGKNSSIGNNTILTSHVAVYDDVSIGESCLIHSHTTICCDSVIGNHCTILPGAVIGSDGFGFVENKDGSYTKIPQIGNVVICDNVEIGANTTIDRAMVGSTVIESGVKLDNLIQIAHNCKIGENSAMAAQVGVSGSTTIGKRTRLGGQVGVAGHLEIGDDVILLAKSGVPSDMKEPGVYIGAPPRKRIEAFRIEAAIHNLPQMVKELEELKRKINKEE